jgi:hypothetical protein
MRKLIEWKTGLGMGAVAVSLIVGIPRTARAVPSHDAEASAAGVSAPVRKVSGQSAPNALAPGLIESPVAQGSQPLENGTATIPFYGYDGNGPMVPPPGDVQAPGHNVEASKTEPDKNTYLVLDGQAGPDPGYDYGRHFLFQGHELGVQGYVTRVNLDADAAHRITLFATEDSLGNPLPVFDGSTWNPFASRLLFTAENGANGGVWQSTLDSTASCRKTSPT